MSNRGGKRENSGAKPKPPAEVASVRIVANVTQAEAAEWVRRGRTAWLRAELRKGEAAEYESRLFGGAYDASRLHGIPKDAPIRKMIDAARDRYNTIRESFGLRAISDWQQSPIRIAPPGKLATPDNQ